MEYYKHIDNYYFFNGWGVKEALDIVNEFGSFVLIGIATYCVFYSRFIGIYSVMFIVNEII